jgi:poly(3-hydroxybutyrate) depolymerase
MTGRAVYGRNALLVLAVLFCTIRPGEPLAARLDPGSGSFEFPFVSAGAPRRITVWYHRPATASADAPIVFVMHGQGRNASTYRRYWIPSSRTNGIITSAT